MESALRAQGYVGELQGRLAAALARAERAEKALEASAYLASLYRDCWLGKTVRDLPEAEAAYVSANAAVVAAALAHPAPAEEEKP
ncbi:hypothetical protein [Methylobacterium sp. WL7]|uniref:hypothetical protein n=1 Tax=Methylobacterium sp. WL7 TaxID=2603900 RepID=UPI0011CB5CE0|nr:hypothetical protein [Methylobacterium sp. WL7]TXN43568.1 hypothetical protein FV233_17885 [Methylobacterium sp. WL7]